jgi:hypothetical protein
MILSAFSTARSKARVQVLGTIPATGGARHSTAWSAMLD